MLKGGGWPFDANTKPLASDLVAELQRDHAGLPADYLDYLATVGWGSLGNDRYMIYGGPIAPDEVYGRTPEGTANMLLIGDDFAGCSAGVRLSDGAVFEIDAAGSRIWEAAPNFEAFIRARIAEFMDYAPAERGAPS